MTRPGNTKQANISLDTELYEKILSLAKEDSRSFSNYVAMVLFKHIKEIEKKSK